MEDDDSENFESESFFSDTNSDSSRAERNKLMEQMEMMMQRMDDYEKKSNEQKQIILNQQNHISSLTAEVGALKVMIFFLIHINLIPAEEYFFEYFNTHP